jgi:two-component system, chemotaxis family, sensor kinase CheA
MDELIDQFLAEGRELVHAAGDDLAALAAGTAGAGDIDNLFRTIHTLKGSTGLFDLQPLGDMLHAVEDLLGALRKGQLAASEAMAELLLRCVDQTGRWLDAFEAAGALPADAPEVGRRLQALVRRELAADETAPATAPEPARDRAWVDRLLAGPVAAPDAAALIAIRYVPRADCFFSGDDPVALLRQVPGLCALSIGTQEPWVATDLFDPFRCNLVFEALSTASRAEVQAALRMVADQTELTDAVRQQPAARAEAEAARDLAGRTLRIDIENIDSLGHIADELVVANNALAHLAAQARAGVPAEALVQGLLANQLTLDRLTGSLHRAVMKVRLVPLGALFRRFPRLVREIGDRLGKELTLVVRGETIEADKSLVDALFEPLLHLLRNAADHGVEPADARRRAGKPLRGVITMSAGRVGDQVVIDIADDGRGIDPAAIRRTVRERGLLADDLLAALGDQDVIDLVFLPGFSTAVAVTEVSGRGVGMDSVRNAVMKLGGRVTLSSKLGNGTSVHLALPVSVVLSSVVIVRCGAERYGVPMDGIIETVRVPADRILPVRNGRAFVLRDTVIPVFDLADLLGLAPDERAGDVKLLVVRRAAGIVAVAVDDFTDRVNLLLRPLAGLLSGMPGVAGTALLGDGRVLMILDVPELIG